MWAPARLTIVFLRRPDNTPVYRDYRYPLRIQPHRVTTSRRQLIFWEQLANPHEHQVSLFRSDELHPAKPDSRVTAGVIGEDDLVRRQRHPEALREEHERARRTVTDNPKHRNPVAFPDDRRGSREVDEQGNVVHSALDSPADYGTGADTNVLELSCIGRQPLHTVIRWPFAQAYA